jgi:hypothetical protein
LAVQIQGTQPTLPGACGALLALEYRYQDVLEDPANVVYLRVGDVWYAFCLDADTLYWWVESERPTSFAAPEINATYTLVDLGRRYGVTGVLLRDVTCDDFGQEIRVVLRFETGLTVVLRHDGNRTTHSAT